MALISLNIPTRAIDNIAARHGYAELYTDDHERSGNPIVVDNPQTKAAFVKQVLIRWAREEAIGFEEARDIDTTREASRTTAEAAITID